MLSPEVRLKGNFILIQRQQGLARRFRRIVLSENVPWLRKLGAWRLAE
jgi:hypothetical protein